MPKKKDIFDIKRRKEKSKRICRRAVKKRVYQTFKVPLDFTSVLCREKKQKKKIVQDYRYLNKGTVKDNYPLSLISDLINTINTKKMFTKINLCQGYNNIQIKEKDE